MECIFCRILSGEIPGAMLYGNEAAAAFLDVNPVAPGHALVVPRKHSETLLDISSKDRTMLMEAVQHVAHAVTMGVNAEGFNVLMNNRPAAGQVVPHAHIHIVPRFAGDGLRLWPGKPYREGQMKRIHEQILKHI